jgi:DNA-binding protein H-NS
MATLESLQAKIKKLEQQAEALATKQASSVIEKIHTLMAEHGLTTADIEAHARGKRRLGKTGTAATSKTSVVAVKYRDPKSGVTWSGRGRAPQWIASAKNRDRFLDEGGAATVKSTSAGKVKVAARKHQRRLVRVLGRDNRKARSRPCIVTRSLARPGVDAVARRRGWLTLRTGRSF